MLTVLEHVTFQHAVLGKKMVINKLMIVQIFTKVRHFASIKIIVGKLPVYYIDLLV